MREQIPFSLRLSFSVSANVKAIFDPVKSFATLDLVSVSDPKGNLNGCLLFSILCCVLVPKLSPSKRRLAHNEPLVTDVNFQSGIRIY